MPDPNEVRRGIQYSIAYDLLSRGFPELYGLSGQTGFSDFALKALRIIKVKPATENGLITVATRFVDTDEGVYRLKEQTKLDWYGNRWELGIARYLADLSNAQPIIRLGSTTWSGDISSGHVLPSSIMRVTIPSEFSRLRRLLVFRQDTGFMLSGNCDEALELIKRTELDGSFIEAQCSEGILTLNVKNAHVGKIGDLRPMLQANGYCTPVSVVPNLNGFVAT